MVDKVIVSNQSALTNKYGADGFNALNSALQNLVKADAARDLTTEVIWVDDTVQMTRLNGRSPVNSKDERGNKAAIDAISPDYIVILDGPDVIPHIILENPLPNDGDSTVESDLPYASPAGFFRQASRYLKVTRVVGRIPNLPGANGPDKIISILDFAARAQPQDASKFNNYFGLSAKVWQASTAMSLEAAFGNHSNLNVAPPAAPPATDRQLARLSHFINCHGAIANPNFFGQLGNDYPVALSSAQVSANAAAGSVIAAECCYGAQLYDPVMAGVADPICFAYLTKGALGFLGSTTIAYGPADSNGQADLLTQYFFENILSGSSLGRALLDARIRFVSSQKMTDASNLKTLVQFLLLGDPSLVPCQTPPRSAAAKELMAISSPLDEAAQRKARRVALAGAGLAIADAKAVISGPGKASEAAMDRVRAIARSRNYKDAKEAVFAIRGGADLNTAMKAKAFKESVMIISTKDDAPQHIVAYRHLIAHLVGDGVVSINEVVSR